MVAIADMAAERSERERMVTLAIENGWIQKVAGWSVERGAVAPVAVLATDDATPPGPLVGVVKNAVAHLRKLPRLQREQKAAGLRPYLVFSLPLAALCELVDADTANDLREAADRNQYAVLCMNGDKEVLISGVSPIGKEG